MAEYQTEQFQLDLETAQKRIRELEEFSKELERARDLLSASEAEHRTAFENSGTGMVVIREDLTVIMANRRIEEITGFPNDEVRHKRKWTDFVLPEEHERMISYHYLRRSSPAGAPSEYEFRLKDKTGNIRDVLATVAMIPGSSHSLVSLLDISARKAMERDLKESEQRFKEIAGLMPGVICEMDLSLNLTYTNNEGLKIIGATEEDLKNGININELIFPEDRERVAKDIYNIFHGDYGNPAVYRLRRKDGRTIQILINAAPIKKQGTLVGIRSCVIDITSRIAAERKLEASETRFRIIFEKSPIGIALFDAEGRLVDENDSFKSLFAFRNDARQPGARTWIFDLIPLREEEKKGLFEGKGISREVECPAKAAEGGEKSGVRWLDWRVTPLCTEGEKPSSFLAQVEDISESKKKQEAQLAQHREATAKAEAMVAGLRRELLEKSRFHSMVSRSQRMRELFDILPEIAVASAHVLIYGESGTGKELVARSLHELSPRGRNTFVAINCAALPDTLLESELFGYRAGAFTDAKKDKPGKFSLAEGGTIFFDEIGDISAAMQAKLLRVLQEKEYEPLGGTASLRADVRVIAATNRDLGDMTKKGTFREDLFYRINVVTIKLPPLRERRADIPLLCDHFVERFNARYGKSIKGIVEEAMETILGHDYPGNIRELENAIEHAFVFCKGGMIESRHLPQSMRVSVAPPGGEDLARITDFGDLERMYISAVLKEAGGSRVQAAKRLGVHKATLFRKLKKLGIP